MDGADRIVSKGSYEEPQAVELLQKLLKAVVHMHRQGVVHRDIKPENILMRNHESDTDFKIADFGFAAHCGGDAIGDGEGTGEGNNVSAASASADHAFSAACGTPAYCAPEILLSQRYGRPVDVWSVGVTAFVLFSGYPPFFSEDTDELFEQIKQADVEFEPPYWSGVSEEAIGCIRSMLEPDPSKRPTAAQVLEHSLFCHHNRSDGGGNTTQKSQNQTRRAAS